MSKATFVIRWPDSVTREDVDDAVEVIFCGCIPGMPDPIDVYVDEFEAATDE